jgi:hypothetical protein
MDSRRAGQDGQQTRQVMAWVREETETAAPGCRFGLFGALSLHLFSADCLILNIFRYKLLLLVDAREVKINNSRKEFLGKGLPILRRGDLIHGS